MKINSCKWVTQPMNINILSNSEFWDSTHKRPTRFWSRRRPTVWDLTGSISVIFDSFFASSEMIGTSLKLPSHIFQPHDVVQQKTTGLLSVSWLIEQKTTPRRYCPDLITLRPLNHADICTLHHLQNRKEDVDSWCHAALSAVHHFQTSRKLPVPPPPAVSLCRSTRCWAQARASALIEHSPLAFTF